MGVVDRIGRECRAVAELVVADKANPASWRLEGGHPIVRAWCDKPASKGVALPSERDVAEAFREFQQGQPGCFVRHRLQRSVVLSG